MTNELTPRDLEVLQGRLTAPRLSSYAAAVDHDPRRTIELYEWNTQASGTVVQLVGLVEVILRNAVDDQLVRWAHRKGARSWLDTVPLDEQGRADITKARDRATRRGRVPEVHGKVIAELSLGFWRFLLAQRYQSSLWVPALRHAFPHGPADVRQRRSRMEEDVQRLLFVRNRAAHHEPIHRRDLSRDVAAAVRVAGSICPVSRRWISSLEQVSAILIQRPS